MMALAWPDNVIAFPQPQGKSNEWYTPARYIEAAQEVMGSIDLDPASCEMANRTVKAKRYYSVKENGLAQEWYGNVWLNPPYDKPHAWICKFCTEPLQQAILTVNAATDTYWFDALWEYPLCFHKKRVEFFHPVNNHKQPRFPSVFIYRGSNEQKFIEVFSKFGTIAKRVSQPRHTIATPSLWEVQS